MARPTPKKAAASKATVRKSAAAKGASTVDPEKAAKDERRRRWIAWSRADGAIDELCEYIGSGGASHNLYQFSQAHGFLHTTMLRWLDADPKRLAQYNQAREFRAERIADEIAEIADEPIPRALTGLDSAAVADKRVRIDTRKWLASKLFPKRYADKHIVGGADDLPPVQSHVSGELKLTPAEAYMRMLGKP